VGNSGPSRNCRPQTENPIRALETTDKLPHVGVIQGRHHFRFAFEPRPEFRVGDKLAGEELEGHLPLDERVFGQVPGPIRGLKRNGQ